MVFYKFDYILYTMRVSTNIEIASYVVAATRAYDIIAGDTNALLLADVRTSYEKTCLYGRFIETVDELIAYSDMQSNLQSDTGEYNCSISIRVTTIEYFAYEVVLAVVMSVNTNKNTVHARGVDNEFTMFATHGRYIPTNAVVVGGTYPFMIKRVKVASGSSTGISLLGIPVSTQPELPPVRIVGGLPTYDTRNNTTMRTLIKNILADKPTIGNWKFFANLFGDNNEMPDPAKIEIGDVVYVPETVYTHPVTYTGDAIPIDVNGDMFASTLDMRQLLYYNNLSVLGRLSDQEISALGAVGILNAVRLVVRT